MKNLTQNEINYIAQQAKNQLAHNYYKDYITQVHHGSYEHFRHTLLICDYLQRIAEGEQLHLMIEVPPRHGKLCADSTPVYTPNGWKTHGQLKVGDYVYHPNGKPVKVTHIKPKTNADWLVTFSNGEQIRTHEHHEWTVYNRSKHKVETLETQKMKEDCYLENRCKYQLQNIAPLQNTDKQLTMDPYVLGAWLGDGTATKPCITYDKKDYAIIENIESRGYDISTTCFHKTTGVPTTYFSGTRWDKGRMTREIEALNLYNNKHIPDIYLKGSIEQRLELLAGLVDTDGHCDSNGRIRYSTTNEKIRDGVYQLALSLGFRPYIMESDPSLSASGVLGKKMVYQIGFNPTMKLPTVLERKTSKRFIKQRRVGIKDISYKPNGEVGRCITVDSPDGLYLVGNTLLPTHNSMTVTETFPSYYLGRNPEKRVITSAYSEGLARKFGRLNRNKFAEMSDNIFGVSLATDNTSNTDWGIKGHRGGMISTGIGGSITGQGADCVLGSTLIDTEIGKIRIDELHKMVHKPKVLSYNHDKEITEYKTIEASRESISNRLITINTMRGNTLTTTSDHRYFTIDKGYTESSNLWFDSLLMDSHNNIDMVDEIIPEKNTVNVYDIQVADNHNFFANNVLVHNCMIIDDPIKNAKEALSKTIRDNIWNEWESTLSTRLHDGASVIVIMTRWHEDDLIGRLLEKSPYNWIRLRLPAIAEDDDDLLNRNIGEALCPELGYDEEWAALKKVEVGSRTWASLYQQRPAPEQGSIIKREWLKYIGAVPARADNLIMSWDFTFKDSQASDYVVGQVWQKTGANYYMIDQVRGQMDFTSSKRALINLKKKYPRCRTILVEDKANGTAIINALQKDISGIIPITPKESKEARAYAVTPYFEAGNVYILENIQDLNDTVEEFVAFPNGKFDDRVDCATQALNYFASKPQASVITTNAW